MTYGALAYDGEGWVLGGLPPHVIIKLKALFPKIPKAAAPPYKFRDTPENAADLHWFTERYTANMTAEDRRLLERRKAGYEATKAALDAILAGEYTPPAFVGLQVGQEVRSYQALAVDMLAKAKGLLLGDEVGLGKTYTAAAACLIPGVLPAVIVCQPHLQAQWARVIKTFTTLRVVEVKTTRPHTLPPADIYVFRYTQLLGWVDTFAAMGVRFVIYDEVQELRTGSGTGKGDAAARLSEAAEYRLGLTATPIYNYGVEIWNILKFLRPEVLGDFYDFVREWCAAAGQIRTVSDPQALGAYLRDSHAFLRRTKHDVGQDMPPVNRIVDTIDYDSKAVDAVEDLARQLAIKATTGAYVERGRAARDLDIMVRQATGVAKAKQVAAFARILVEGGEPIVLVGWHREVYDLWLEALKDLAPAMYTGSETATQKERERDRFLSGETDILIMSLRSGAGLDGLQARCSTMVFGELDWSPGVHHQCIGRLDREGQTEPVTAIFLVVDEGSDPPMMEVLGLKSSEAARIVDPGLGVQAAHSDMSAVQRLVQRYLSTKRRAA